MSGVGHTLFLILVGLKGSGSGNSLSDVDARCRRSNKESGYIRCWIWLHLDMSL